MSYLGNVKALKVAEMWTPEIEEKVNKALSNDPIPELNWLKFAPRPLRRATRVTYNFKVGGIDADPE